MKKCQLLKTTKRTLQLLSFIESEKDRYCQQIGLVPNPLFIYDDIDLMELCDTKKEFNEIKRTKLGMSWKFDNVFWINIDGSDFIWQLIDTLTHELIHLKWPDMKHGDEYQQLVNMVIMGKRF